MERCETSKNMNHEAMNESRNKDHLNKNTESIIASISTLQDAVSESGTIPSFDIKGFKESSDEVEYDPDTDYTISSINERWKYTRGLANCTTLIVTGIERATGKNISFLTHQDDLSSHKTTTFNDDLKNSMEKIKSMCLPGTIDAVIAGGSFAHPVRQRKYMETIQRLSVEVKNVLHFEPYVIVGPKLGTEDETIYYDTPNRKAYVIRPNYTQGDGTNKGFKPSNINDVSLTWKKTTNEARD